MSAEPLERLLAELEPEFGASHLFRPYRDVRFSKDKLPYKDHQGAFCGAEDGVGWYVQVSAPGTHGRGRLVVVVEPAAAALSRRGRLACRRRPHRGHRHRGAAPGSRSAAT